MSVKQIFLLIVFCIGVLDVIYAKLPSKNLADPYIELLYDLVLLDTIPLIDRKGDFITDNKSNPFDITTNEIKQKVEYDPATGHYVIMEKIGDEYYRTPSYMTFEEYLEYRAKQQERQYF
ncbi:MAG: hypothetical protein WAU01_17690, partial [Saprospiraceae bacterium]